MFSKNFINYFIFLKFHSNKKLYEIIFNQLYEFHLLWNKWNSICNLNMNAIIRTKIFELVLHEKEYDLKLYGIIKY